MLRLAALAAGVLLTAAAPAHGGTTTYSSGPLVVAIPDRGLLEQPMTVPDGGIVSHVAVSVRIDHPRVRDLTLTLVSPTGTSVLLIARRGRDGRDLGRGRGCGGRLARFADGAYRRVEGARAPFTDRPVRPERPLAALRRHWARGRWTLQIADAEPGAAGTLRCWKLELTRDVLRVRRGRLGRVTAELLVRETAGIFRQPRLRILRSGRVVYSRRLRRLGCGGCPTWRPSGRPVVRNLDATAEPEVIVDFYSGGAHCCSYSLILRYRPERGRYVKLLHWWGNPGYRLLDLGRDGRLEFQTTDDRFAYAFAAYVASLEPIRIWRYDRGRMLDVTRRFGRLIERDARSLWRLYLRARRAPTREVRGILAAWLADMLMLGRGDEGWRRLEAAYRRGDVGRGATMFGYPAGRHYLAALRNFLRRTGYL